MILVRSPEGKNPGCGEPLEAEEEWRRALAVKRLHEQIADSTAGRDTPIEEYPLAAGHFLDRNCAKALR